MSVTRILALLRHRHWQATCIDNRHCCVARQIVTLHHPIPSHCAATVPDRATPSRCRLRHGAVEQEEKDSKGGGRDWQPLWLPSRTCERSPGFVEKDSQPFLPVGAQEKRGCAEGIMFGDGASAGAGWIVACAWYLIYESVYAGGSLVRLEGL